VNIAEDEQLQQRLRKRLATLFNLRRASAIQYLEAIQRKTA
jgi:ribosomal protein L29